MKRIINIFVILMLLSCSLEAQINVVPVTDSELQIKKNSFIYALPRVTININVCVETEYFFPGPYQKYADKYLTLKNTGQEASVVSKIKNVEIKQITEPDPNATYIVFFKKNKFLVNYYNSNIIKSIGSSDSYEFGHIDNTTLTIPQYLTDDVVFSEMSIKRNFINITDTTYKVIEVDSVFQKIPVYNKVITSKEFEQKAEEAANYLIKIRKRKFKLMTGQFETETPIADVKSLIDELEKLEEEYLSLFIGKTVKIENVYNFKYTPLGNSKEEKIVMFYLSDEFGIVENEISNSEPVYCLLINRGNTAEIDRFYHRQTELAKKDKKKGLFYRIPGYASIKIVHDDIHYAEQIIMVPQCGYINYLPSKLFKNKALNIIFDENSGSVKTISNE
ncbi:MAG: DUF4831 family protein [Bacteroidales bacterium]|nr:DUF4831 family protein [Bacteroidales bacterium]